MNRGQRASNFWPAKNPEWRTPEFLMGEPLWRCVTDDLMTSYPRSFSDDLCFCSDISDVEPFHHFTCGKIANLTPMFVSWCLHARIYTAVNWRISNPGHMHNNWNFIGSTCRYWCDELNKIPLSTAPVLTVVCWIHSSCILLYQSVSEYSVWMSWVLLASSCRPRCPRCWYILFCWFSAICFCETLLSPHFNDVSVVGIKDTT